MKKYYHKLVLIIDSDEMSSFFNKTIIKQTDIAKNVIAVSNCSEALDYISPKKTLHSVPEIIFLDIKTPLLNGWEFLAKYDELGENLKQNIVITSSSELLKEEKVKLQQYTFVKSFANKNLDQAIVNDINNQLSLTKVKCRVN